MRVQRDAAAAAHAACGRLQILSLARNSLLRIEGLDAVGSTLDQLWLSYNQISKLAGLENCDKARTARPLYSPT